MKRGLTWEGTGHVERAFNKDTLKHWESEKVCLPVELGLHERG